MPIANRQPLTTKHKGFTPHYFYNRYFSVVKRCCATIVSRPKNVFYKNSAGFTLIEVVVSVFIFLIIMVSVSQIFVSAFQGYNYAKTVQRDMQSAQFAINTMAKELRTSSVVSASGSQSFVQFYDHSQGICFKYQRSGTELQVAQYTDSGTESAKQQACATRNSFPSFTTIASGINSGVFQVTPSDKTLKIVGKVTTSLRIGEGNIHQVRIQTTVSLRDYENVGI